MTSALMDVSQALSQLWRFLQSASLHPLHRSQQDRLAVRRARIEGTSGITGRCGRGDAFR